MTLRRSERPRYPLHRTIVAKTIRPNVTKVIVSFPLFLCYVSQGI